MKRSPQKEAGAKKKRRGATAATPAASLFPIRVKQTKHAGRSVVVSAPTGSGKTAIAELAVYLSLAAGQRAIYTTPLKALSNQKYDELSRKFGRESVGLLTLYTYSRTCTYTYAPRSACRRAPLYTCTHTYTYN